MAYSDLTLEKLKQQLDIKKALLLVENHIDEFERRWDEYFSKG
jgi:hypothetical protein